LSAKCKRPRMAACASAVKYINVLRQMRRSTPDLCLVAHGLQQPRDRLAREVVPEAGSRKKPVTLMRIVLKRLDRRTVRGEPGGHLAQGQDGVNGDVGDRVGRHARVGRLYRVLDQCGSAAALDGQQPRHAVVLRPGERDAHDAAVVGLGGAAHWTVHRQGRQGPSLAQQASLSGSTASGRSLPPSGARRHPSSPEGRGRRRGRPPRRGGCRQPAPCGRCAGATSPLLSRRT
jgi:hypothetical protein